MALATLAKCGPNDCAAYPSLKLTGYGRHVKPGLSHSYYRLRSGLQCLPTRGAWLERLALSLHVELCET
jgi:hypothetical protein